MLQKSLFFALLILFSSPGFAQFIGYVSPQTVQQTLASGVACTGTQQVFPISNLGQTQHYLTIGQAAGPQATQLQAFLAGVDTKGNLTRISDHIEGDGTVGTVKGSGYYPIIEAVVNCIPAVTTSFNLTYSGAWGTFDAPVGSYLNSAIDKLLFNQSSEASNQVSDVFATPFGSSAGTFYFTTSSAGAGGSIQVKCQTVQTVAPVIFTASIQNSLLQQVFTIPAFNCPFLQVTWFNNGTAGVITGEYVLSTPGNTLNGDFYTHITGTTATVVKGTPGFLHTVSINTGAVGTFSVFDLASASCTGTPAKNQIAVIATSTSEISFPFDVNAVNGICVKASVAMDITVSAQ